MEVRRLAELMSTHEVHWKIGDQDVSCRIDGSRDHGVLHFSGGAVPFRIMDSTHIEISGRRHQFYVIHDHDGSTVWLDGHTYHLQRTQKTSAPQMPAAPSTGEVHALMPGKLVRLAVAIGDVVTTKQVVAVMESMKMETSLFAPVAGRVEEIHFKPGDVVDMGEVVMTIKNTESSRES